MSQFLYSISRICIKWSVANLMGKVTFIKHEGCGGFVFFGNYLPGFHIQFLGSPLTVRAEVPIHPYAFLEQYCDE